MNRLSLAIVFLLLPAAVAAQAAVEVSLSGLGSWSPSGAGESWGQETRWTGEIGTEYQVLLDKHDSGQLRLTVCRAWADLPMPQYGAVDTRTLAVSGEVSYSGAHRFHLHTCPTRVWNRRQAPTAPDLPALIAAGKVPNYVQPVNVTETTLAKIADGRYPWERFATRFNAPYDAWTEEYGRIVGSFTGGGHAGGGTEPSPIEPFQLVYLATGDSRAWEATLTTAETSGNYAIHYRSRATGRVIRYQEQAGVPSCPASLPAALCFLQSDPHVLLQNAGGKNLPIPDVAHQYTLAYVAALVTGERYFVEELEAWNAYNLLRRPPGPTREQGIVAQGEVRAAAWATYRLLQLIHALPAGADRDHYAGQLRANLAYLSGQGRPSGYLRSHSPGMAPGSYKKNANTVHFSAACSSHSPTWNHNVFAWVTQELVAAGYPEAQAIRDTLLRVTEGVTSHSQTRWDWGWGNHCDATTADTETWPEIIANTFAKRSALPTTWTAPARGHYVAWARSGIVAGAGAGKSWAGPALSWLDGAYQAPQEWAILPRTAGTEPPPPPPPDPDPEPEPDPCGDGTCADGEDNTTCPADCPPPPPSGTLRVGPGEQYATLSAALAAAPSGARIEIAAGTYTDDPVTVTKPVTIVGVGGRAHLQATVPPPNGKGLIVARADLVVESLEFSGVRVADGNGAGIRHEIGDLTVRDSYFHDSETGILGGGGDTATTLIETSTFERLGKDGAAHGVYINATGALVVRRSWFKEGTGGHLLKSRAKATTIEDSTIDETGGPTSHAVDLPQSGAALIADSTIIQGSESPNRAMVVYGAEAAKPQWPGKLTVTGTTFTSNTGQAAVGIRNDSAVPMALSANTFAGVSTPTVGPVEGGTPPPPPPPGEPVCVEGIQAADGTVTLVQPIAECGPVSEPEPVCPVVNVNAATAEQVAYLPGIGPVLSVRIVAGRPFSVPEDLLGVKGIGPATLAGLRDYVVFEGATTATSEISAEDCI